MAGPSPCRLKNRTAASTTPSTARNRNFVCDVILARSAPEIGPHHQTQPRRTLVSRFERHGIEQVQVLRPFQPVHELYQRTVVALHRGGHLDLDDSLLVRRFLLEFDVPRGKPRARGDLPEV